MPRIVVNNTVASNVIYKTQYTSVWVKPYYNNDWRYVPYLFPESSTEAAAPSDSEATLSWDYGKYVNLWGDPGGTLLPLNLENWHVRILVHTVYGTYISWIGIIVGESLTETGIDVETGYPRGEQILECRGLEYLLERRCVVGTYVGNDSEWAYLPRTRDFNVGSSRRENLAGNRSAATNIDSGTYLFSTDGNKWSNLDIIKYLLAAFQPWMPYEQYNQLFYAPQFRIAGQTSALNGIFEEHRLGGRTIRECLNTLIDRKRGMGWKIQTDGANSIYIYIYSLSQFAITGNGANLPANTRQIDVPIHDDKFIAARYRISSMSQVDQIVVESDEPIRTCATLRFADGTLEPAWSPDLDEDIENNPDETNYRNLAQYIYQNWDVANIYTQTWARSGPNYLLSFDEVFRLSEFDTTPFDFLQTDEFGLTAREVRIGFNKLDVDGDGYLSKEDLLTFEAYDEYQLVSEAERASDKYAAVFSEFQVPRVWNWQGWSPHVYPNGVVDLNINGAYWIHDIEMHRYLPFMLQGGALDSDREYMEPFAFIEKPNRNREFLMNMGNGGAYPYTFEQAQALDPETTRGQFEIYATGDYLTLDDINAGLADEPAVWIQLDRAQQLDLPACSLRMGDSGMKIVVKSEYNHVFAKNHTLSGTYEKQPVFDYETLEATVFFDTDMKPRVAMPVFTGYYRDYYGDIQGQQSPTGKQIYIEVPGKQVWCVAPNTVKGFLEGEKVYYNDGAGGFMRDDSADLRFIAQLAYMWYGQQRASIDMTIQNQYPFFQIGDLVRSTISGWSFERVGTCVTAITRNYQDGTHNVSTGYGELDPVAFGEKFGGKMR
jgi:hypothetical protein